MVNDKQRKNYYKKKNMIKQIVLRQLAKSGNILTGQRALNRLLPNYLDKITKDYDILTRKGVSPQKASMILEKKLDRYMGFNAFESVAGDYPGVVKVRSKVEKSTIADYTKPKKKPKYKRDFDGVNVAGLGHLKKKFKEALANPEAKFRHAKDSESLQRIRIYEKERASKNFDMFKMKPVPRSKNKRKEVNIW